ncbi:MAG: hypothetical protein HQL44_16095 [Alphaproteobacteria bacterium]|nr:hypothetical protein [Alphaproteobacteria bacterium]
MNVMGKIKTDQRWVIQHLLDHILHTANESFRERQLVQIGVNTQTKAPAVKSPNAREHIDSLVALAGV